MTDKQLKRILSDVVPPKRLRNYKLKADNVVYVDFVNKKIIKGGK